MKKTTLLTLLLLFLIIGCSDSESTTYGLSSLSITPDSGTYSSEQYISITHSEIGVNIFYTLNGDIPTRDSDQYVSAFQLPAGEHTLKAIGFKGDKKTAVITKNYTITGNVQCETANDCGNNAVCVDNVCQCTTGYSGDPLVECNPNQTDGFTVYFKKPDSWGVPNIYYWETDPIIDSVEWPGVVMEHFEGDWYRFHLSVNSSSIIFNDGTSQTDDLTRDKDGWYTDNQWHDTRPQEFECENDTDCGTNAVCRNNVCECPTGYSGDPLVECTENSQPECENDTDCGTDAVCTNNVCECPTGYSGDPLVECTENSQPECENDTDCGTDAVCTNNICECPTGYIGNPLVECIENQASDKPYSINPTFGQEVNTPIVIDGENTAGEWNDDMLIALDMANDDPRSLGENWTMHEAPVDYTHIWAAWDDNNLYLAWQLVDVTDVIDPNNAGSGDAVSGNDGILQWIVIDTDSSTGAELDMWDKNGGEPYWTGATKPDYQIYIASSLWQGYISRAQNGEFPVDDGGENYFSLEQAGIDIEVGNTLVPSEIWGVMDADDRDNSEEIVEFINQGHSNTSRDSFYEIKIPLSFLGIDKATLEQYGVGVMVGMSLDTIPHDEATLDTEGVETWNSSFEWGDVDSLTTPFAKVSGN